MHNVLLLGAGKIGRMIVRLLADSGDYQITVGDADTNALERIAKLGKIKAVVVDASNKESLLKAMEGSQSVLSALSFHFNPLVAEVALEAGLSYFDLTEDVETTRRVRATSEFAKPGQIFMPQCGLAPGFISIIANHLSQKFDSLETVRMRVGALPQFPTGALKYNLTWSTDGLINEYCNPCEAIHEREKISVLPLEGLEHFSFDGVRYEAFNTSGGLGTLCDSLDGQVRELNYKTIRYLGHRDLMVLLVNELRLSKRRDLLKDILEHSIPVTFQDVVVTFCTVTGYAGDQLVQISDARKVYQKTIEGETWSAIQVTTAAGICAVLDMHADGKFPSRGFVRQEQVDFDAFINNRFGKHYDAAVGTSFNAG